MGQIVGGAAKPKRCNLNKLSQLGTPAAGEHILVSSDNSMNAAGQGNFDCYIVGNGRTTATELELKSLVDDGAFDISAYRATGNVLAKYVDLSAALDGGNNIPEAFRKGGISVKFVQSSDNKYVQYRLMSTSFSTTESDWQGVDAEPTAGSQNLVTSGGVAEAIDARTIYDTTIISDLECSIDSSSYIIKNFPVTLEAGKTYKLCISTEGFESTDKWSHSEAVKLYGASSSPQLIVDAILGIPNGTVIENSKEYIGIISPVYNYTKIGIFCASSYVVSNSKIFTVNVKEFTTVKEKISKSDAALEKRVAVNKAQSFTDAEQTQALNNLGISGIDTAPVADSDKLITSGGVEKELYKFGNELNGIHEVSRTYNNTELTSANRAVNKVRLQAPSTSVSVKAESQMETKPTIHLSYSADGQNWAYLNAIGSSQYGNVYTFQIPNTAKYISLYSSDTTLQGDILFSVSIGEIDGILDRLNDLEQSVQVFDSDFAAINTEIDGFHEVSGVYDVTSLVSGNRSINKIDLVYPTTTISFEAATDIASPPVMHLYKSTDGINWVYINDIGSSQYNTPYPFTIDETIKYISFYVNDASQYTGNIKITIQGVQINGINDNINLLFDKNTLIEDEVGIGVPSYYKQHVDDKIQQIFDRHIGCGQHGDTFIFITDTHIGANVGLQTNYNYGHSGDLIRYINNNLPISKVIHGGDMIDGGYYLDGGKKDFMKFNYEFRKIDWVGIVGNHDTNASGAQSSASYFTDSEIYSCCVKNAEKHTDTQNKNYYYIDNKSQKIRYVFLDLHWYQDVDQRGVSMNTSEQLSWIDTISNDIGSDWNMIFFAHVFFTTLTYIEDYIFEFQPSSLANSFISKIDAIAADPNKPTVIGIICGHVHYDYNIYSDEGYPIISSCDDAFWGFTATGQTTHNPSYRDVGTITEQSFDVVTVDTVNRKIYMTKIGYGSDREFSY